MKAKLPLPTKNGACHCTLPYNGSETFFGVVSFTATPVTSSAWAPRFSLCSDNAGDREAVTTTASHTGIVSFRWSPVSLQGHRPPPGEWVPFRSLPGTIDFSSCVIGLVLESMVPLAVQFVGAQVFVSLQIP